MRSGARQGHRRIIWEPPLPARILNAARHSLRQTVATTATKPADVTLARRHSASYDLDTPPKKASRVGGRSYARPRCASLFYYAAWHELAALSFFGPAPGAAWHCRRTCFFWYVPIVKGFPTLRLYALLMRNNAFEVRHCAGGSQTLCLAGRDSNDQANNRSVLFLAVAQFPATW